LRASQADDCARIHAAGFAYPWSPAELEALISAPSSLGLAALDPASGKLRGFLLARLAADEAEILTVAVDPAIRKGGVGRDLLRAALAQAAAAGATRMFLEVDADNAAALALYARFQFVKVGERKGYYKRPDGKAATALTMRRDLA
jgi:ribosomal-protein-alanine N-acetyltransferase